jgi:predicted PurR-regulated permease PerM
MQGSVNLNTVILFLSLLVGAKIGGLLGILLAIPLAGTLVNIFDLDELKK